MSTTIFWLSFADPKKPKGSQFLGACILEVDSESSNPLEKAIHKAHELGINPGGEVLGFEIGRKPHDSWMNVLLNREEIKYADNPSNPKWREPRRTN